MQSPGITATPKRRRIPHETEEAIRALYREGTRTTPEVLRSLKGQIGAGSLMDYIPDRKTISDILDEMDALDRSEPWVLLQSEPLEVEPGLAALAAVMRRTGGRQTSISQAVVKVLAKIWDVTNGLEDWERYLTARLYVERAAKNESTLDLDMFLARAPWRGEVDLYASEIVAGFYPPAPISYHAP